MKLIRSTFATTISSVVIILLLGTSTSAVTQVQAYYFEPSLRSLAPTTGSWNQYRHSDEASPAVSGDDGILAEADWPMAAANPQRTSWTPEEVRGDLRPIWHRSIESFVNNKIQVIATHDTLFMSSSRGLYALSVEDIDCSLEPNCVDGSENECTCNDNLGGDLLWVFPTELPLGHSPTVYDHPTLGPMLFVGGYDRKLYALDADPDLGTLPVDNQTHYRINDQVLWVFEAGHSEQDPTPEDDPGFLGAGFETNPLVVSPSQLPENLTVYAGNRNGYLYALDASSGDLKWKYRTEGPILFSPAFKDNSVYFASNDSHAYALDASTGSLIWKSDKLLGGGFYSFWPVIYQDYVVFVGSEHYSNDSHPHGVGAGSLATQLDRADLYADVPDGALIGPLGTVPGDWAPGTVTIDDSRAAEYYENKPWRRRYFVLSRATGQEFTFDSDGDGRPEYAPISYTWTHSGSRYPPAVAADGVLYQHNSYVSHSYIPLGGISGWKFGTEIISRVHEGNYGAVDEPLSWSAGGNLIYWALTCDREAGAYDITIPYGTPGRFFNYYAYNLGSLSPGLESDCSLFGGENGIYGSHGTVNPPIPYKGKVYIQKSNAVIGLAPSSGTSAQLPLLRTVRVDGGQAGVSLEQLKQKLAAEIEKMLAAGHLRPGYYSSGINDHRLNHAGRNFLTHYFYLPTETLDTLVRALPHLPFGLRQQTEEYLRQEYSQYQQYIHLGWAQGASREAFPVPPEVQDRMDSHDPETSIYGMQPWAEQYRFYGLWHYAQEFGNAVEVFESNRDRLSLPADGDEVAAYPYAHNAYIAGYWGYLELEKLAGYPESSAVRAELDRLLALRATTFTKDLQYGWEEPLSIAANFMYLTPELGQYLHDHAYDKVAAALQEYNDTAPGWFVSKYDASCGEGTLQILQDYDALFQAKGLILKESRAELVKYLDVPGFMVGDLYYLRNLITAIEARTWLQKAAEPRSSELGSVVTYTLSFNGDGGALSLTDTLPTGMSAPLWYELSGTGVTPNYDTNLHRLTWMDSPAEDQKVTIKYAMEVTTAEARVLANQAELTDSSGLASVANAYVLVNPKRFYLPAILRGR